MKQARIKLLTGVVLGRPDAGVPADTESCGDSSPGDKFSLYRTEARQQCARSTLNKTGQGRANLMLRAGAQGLQPQQSSGLPDIFDGTLCVELLKRPVRFSKIEGIGTTRNEWAPVNRHRGVSIHFG